MPGNALPERSRRRPSRALLAVGALVVLTSPFAVDPLWDAVSGEGVAYASLERPVSYLFAAPLFGVWDTLSLLTLSQHYAVLATLVALYSGLRLRVSAPGIPPWVRLSRELGLAAGALLLLLLFYAGGLLLPRPMVGLQLERSELVSIDFHSHTHHSHDGWSRFTAARNRAWHEAGGFDVAYVTDHYTWAGVDDSTADNPERVGERTTLLSGTEIRIHRRPTNALGDRSRYQFALDSGSVYMEPDSLEAAYARDGRPPTLLYTMPGGLEWVVPFSDERPSGVIAIEINDGSPRGLEQVKRERARILALADSADLAVIGAANLHGWGRTVAAWSVMEIPGWQEMTPGEIGDAIETKLHAERRRAVTVVERRMPYHDGAALGVVLTLPVIAFEHFRMLSMAERAAWLAWLAALAALGAALAGYRAGAPGQRPTERSRLVARL